MLASACIIRFCPLTNRAIRDDVDISHHMEDPAHRCASQSLGIALSLACAGSSM